MRHYACFAVSKRALFALLTGFLVLGLILFGVRVTFAAINSTGIAGEFTSALDNNSEPAFSYYDAVDIDLRLAQGGSTATPLPTHTPLPLRPDTIGVYKTGVFYLRNTNNTGEADITAYFGGDVSDLPVVGDWNGDGADTVGIYRSSTAFFFLSDSNTAPNVDYTVLFGNPDDTPFAGHWTNDMTGSGIGVYRSSNGIFYEKKTLVTGFADYFAIFGDPGDQGFAGDWEIDGYDSIGVYRSSNQTWYLSSNSTPSGAIFSDINFVWFASGIPIAGDWDATGTSTVGHGNTVTGLFTLNDSNAAPSSLIIFPFGPTGGKPIAGKWTIPAKPPTPVIIQSGISISNPNAGGD